MTHTIIHASDDIQRQAAEQIRQSVETARNLRDQAAYWQGKAQSRIKKTMQKKQYGKNYGDESEANG